MDHFLRYFEDHNFVKWVQNPTDESNTYWENLIRQNPEEKEDIEFARIALQQLQAAKEIPDKENSVIIYTRLLDQIQEKKNKTLRQRFLPWLKYAAIAIFFLSLGILITDRFYQNPSYNFDDSIVPTQGSSEAQLILSDGRTIALNSKESNIDYQVDGKIIINQQDTVINSTASAKSEMNQLVMPYGKSSSVRLSDGTVVYINAGSRLMYPETFSGKTREVMLIGEAYFEVAQNEKKPFVVKTNDLNVVALGTKFNVSAYTTDKMIETVLVEGKVVLRDNSFGIFKKDFVIKPNEMAYFNRETLETKSRQVETSQYTAWHNGFLLFESIDLSRIILQVERYYNIRLILENSMDGSRSISGKLVLEEETERVLKVLASTAGIELYQINETTYGLK